MLQSGTSQPEAGKATRCRKAVIVERAEITPCGHVITETTYPSIAHAARALCIPRNTLAYRLKRRSDATVRFVGQAPDVVPHLAAISRAAMARGESHPGDKAQAQTGDESSPWVKPDTS